MTRTRARRADLPTRGADLQVRLSNPRSRRADLQVRLDAAPTRRADLQVRRRLACAALLAALVAACANNPPSPAALDAKNDQCAFCRMGVVSPTFAAQIVRAGDEPRFFDDLGCLQAYVKGAGVDAEAIVYVADHRTGAWVDARAAVFTRTSLQTPMASGLVAHADAASRDADPAAAGGAPVARAEVVP